MQDTYQSTWHLVNAICTLLLLCYCSPLEFCNLFVQHLEPGIRHMGNGGCGVAERETQGCREYGQSSVSNLGFRLCLYVQCLFLITVNVQHELPLLQDRKICPSISAQTNLPPTALHSHVLVHTTHFIMSFIASFCSSVS